MQEFFADPLKIMKVSCTRKYPVLQYVQIKDVNLFHFVTNVFRTL